MGRGRCRGQVEAENGVRMVWFLGGYWVVGRVGAGNFFRRPPRRKKREIVGEYALGSR